MQNHALIMKNYVKLKKIMKPDKYYNDKQWKIIKINDEKL